MESWFEVAHLPVTPNIWMVWLLGVSLGLTACTATCLPFMAAWVLGRADGAAKPALRDTGWFLAGRMLAYAGLGLLAGYMGAGLVRLLSSGLGNIMIGLSAWLAAFWLLRPRAHGCGSRLVGMPPLWLGVSLSLTPCAPLAALLTLSAASGDWQLGLRHGLAFGAGAVLTPLLLLLPLLGRFGQSLRQQQAWLAPVLRLAAASALLLLGLRRLLL